MCDHQAVMQQALDALLAMNQCLVAPTPYREWDRANEAACKAIESIRAALSVQVVGRKPLADQRIDEEWFYIHDLNLCSLEKARLLARAVEAAHGITEPNPVGNHVAPTSENGG